MAKRYLSSKPRVVALQEPPEQTSAAPRPHLSCGETERGHRLPEPRRQTPSRAVPASQNGGRRRRYLSALTGGLRSRMTATAAAPLAYCAMPSAAALPASLPSARLAEQPAPAGRGGTGRGTAQGWVTVSAARSVRLNINHTSGGLALLESLPDAKKRGRVFLREKSSGQIREQPSLSKGRLREGRGQTH